MRAEWTKLRTTPDAAWLLLVTVIVTLALGAAVCAAATTCGTKVLLSGVYAGQAPVAVLGVLVVSGEYSTGLIHTTLAAVPSRATVMAAKAVVVAVAVAVTGTAMSLVALAEGSELRAAGHAVAYLVLIAVLSVGVSAVVHDSAVAIGSVLGLLYLPPILAPLVANPHVVEELAPMTAGLPVLTAWSLGALLVGTLRLR
ncbi:ABC transporter permease [Kribbella soli]|uniref:ABC transporter permease n=1 Tax=Kribbella soli TaxID=1124743 RepID=UPI00192D9101|nr:ABC transporter permease [Kribbella soli]